MDNQSVSYNTRGKPTNQPFYAVKNDFAFKKLFENCIVTTLKLYKNYFYILKLNFSTSKSSQYSLKVILL